MEVSVVHHPHPVIPSAGQQQRMHAWKAGETVRELLLRHGYDAHQEIVILLNDRLLTVEEWDTVCPQPSDIINVKAAVSGGGGNGGSNPLQVVLTIVVMVVAWYYAPVLFGYGAGAAGYTAAGAAGMGAYVSITAAVLTVAGNALVSTMFAPSGRGLSSANGLENAGRDTPNYSLSGGSNRLRPYEPLPVVMGKHRLFPDYGAKPYTEFIGEDQYLYQIFNFGLSAPALTDFRIGNTPLSSYADVTMKWSGPDGSLPGFPGNVDTIGGAQLLRGSGWIVRTTSIDTYRIAVDVEGVAYYSGDTGLLPCSVVVEAWYAPAGSDQWKPMASRTVVSYTTHYWSLQANGQQFSFAYDGHYEGEFELVTNTGGWWSGEGYYQQPQDVYATWSLVSFAEAEQRGWLHPDPIPSYSTSYTLLINHGASQKSQRRSIVADVPVGQYDVRVRLVSASSSKGEIGDSDSRGGYNYTWSAMRSYQEDKANYVGQTRLGLIIRASGQLNGTLQTLSALASASCLYYDGTAWAFGQTSNPAWWFLDFAIGRKDGAGRRMYGCHMAWDQVDIEAIIAWASFCEAEGLTCDLVLDRTQSAADVLTAIARCGLGSPSWASGKLGAVWDRRNASPVAVFGMSNIIKGSFSVQYVTENLADEIVVSYVDADNDYVQAQARVPVPGGDVPVRSSTVEALGCTNAAMALKFGRVLAAQQVYRRRMITWDADFEGFVCQRGDVVLLSHDLTQWGYSGRIVATDGAALQLDRPVPQNGQANYLMIRRPDGDLATYRVLAASGESDHVALEAQPDLQGGELPLDHIWFFSPLPTPGKRVKVVSIQPQSESRIRIVATDEDQAYYAAWDGDFGTVTIPTQLQDPVPQISGMDAHETLAMVGGRVMSSVEVAWRVTGRYDYALVRWKLDRATEWSEYTRVTETQHAIALERTGSMVVEITPYGGMHFGAPATVRCQVYGKSLPPADITGFAVTKVNGVAVPVWDAHPDLDVRMGGLIVIRHSPDVVGATWENSYVLEAFDGNLVTGVCPLMTGTYLAKACDSSGNWSEQAASFVATEGMVTGFVTVGALVEDPAFPGVKSQVFRSGGEIQLAGASLWDDLGEVDGLGMIDALGGIVPAGEYAFSTALDLGSVATRRFQVDIKARSFDTGDYIDLRTMPIDAWPDFDGEAVNDCDVTVLVSTTDSDPAASPTWGPWVPFFVSDFTCRAARFKAVLESGAPNHNIAMTRLRVAAKIPA